FAFQFTASGIVGAVLHGQVSGPDFGGHIDLGGTVSFLVNTTITEKQFTIGGDSVTVPAAATGSFFVRAEGTAAHLTVFDNTLIADSFILQNNGSAVTVIGTNLSFLLAAGGKRILSIDHASFAFRFTDTGIAGAIVNGNVQGPDFANITLSGTV